MSSFPDLSSHGYQIVRELGHNRAGGRVTYLAMNQRSRQPVVIKQFQFASTNTNWSDYDAYQREIQVLQGLSHPSIPCYLGSFQTASGFCLVQEYKQAPSLAVKRSFDADEIKQIAIAILEILVYLQNRIPVVIHRDIKPENILVDNKINVYLVDFGLARIGEGEVAMSSVAKGTLGFMPPEQLFNQHLTEASDLYGLGTTLICLLTGTKSTEISQLIDEDYRINFKSLVPKLSLRWIEWLEKMVELKPKDRYPNATTALEALKPIYIIRVPEAQLSQTSLELKAKKLGEKLTQTITVSNFTPDTVLEGCWQVAPHPEDPPHNQGAHTWITLTPTNFASNQATCRITVATRKLRADTTYERTLLLNTNSLPETHAIPIKVNTAAVPIKVKQLPYTSLTLLVLFATIATWVEAIAWSHIVATSGSIGIAMAVFVGVFVAGFGGVAAAMGRAIAKVVSRTFAKFGIKLKVIDTTVVLLIAGIAAFFVNWFGTQFRAMDAAVAAFAAVDLVVFIAAFEGENVAESCVARGFSSPLSLGISLLATALGISLGMGFQQGFMNPLIVSAIVGTGLPLSALILYPPLERAFRIAGYRKFEQHLIKP